MRPSANEAVRCLADRDDLIVFIGSASGVLQGPKGHYEPSVDRTQEVRKNNEVVGGEGRDLGLL